MIRRASELNKYCPRCRQHRFHRGETKCLVPVYEGGEIVNEKSFMCIFRETWWSCAGNGRTRALRPCNIGIAAWGLVLGLTDIDDDPQPRWDDKWKRS